MKRIHILIIFLIGNLNIQGQEDKPSPWSVSGYVKQLQSVYRFDGLDSYLLDNLMHNRINFRYEPSSKIRAVVEVRNRLFYGDFVKINANYAQQVETANNDFFDLSVNWADRDSWVLNSTIDRAYLEYTSGALEMRFGRQRINWGISTVWNPNDLFNAFSFTDFDYEERPGSDALRVKYYTGVASSIEFAANISETWNDRVIAAMYKWNVAQYDFQILTGFAKDEWVFGGGWAGNIKTAGIKGEFTYFTPNGQNEKSSFSFTTAADYSFANSLVLALGYLYNSNGNTRGSLTDLFSFALSAKNLYPYRHALFSSIAYPLTPLLNSSLSIIYSPVTSQPLFLNPSVSYSVAQSWDWDLVGQVAFNKEGSRYTSPVTAIFLRLKLSF